MEKELYEENVFKRSRKLTSGNYVDIQCIKLGFALQCTKLDINGLVNESLVRLMLEVRTEVLEHKNFIKTWRLTEVGLAALSTVTNVHQRGQWFKTEVVKRKINTDMSRKTNISLVLLKLRLE